LLFCSEVAYYVPQKLSNYKSGVPHSAYGWNGYELITW